MLPPLNLADAKRDFFSPRKRNHVRRSTIGVSTPNGVGFSPQTHRKGSTDAILETPGADGDATCSGSALVMSLSLIPREFFVVERNSVLPAGQYPPSIYQSSFSAGEGGLWETIVFPALAPQTRQQVLYLRQTLEKLREVLLRASAAEDVSPSSPITASASPRRQERVQRAVVEFTKQEARIYSVCFHELTRQVKFICKEQSELLCEVRERYDTIVSRLADRILQLDDEHSHLEERINELSSQIDDLKHANTALKRTNSRQAALIDDLKLHPSTRSGNDSDQSEEEDDDEAQEAEWQRQRRELASVDAVTSTKKRRDSVAEENLAAARVQTAFHKFQMRKAQHALALRVEKNVAALDIQRSYRGFRGRQRTLHHRAVMQTIMKRREQIAAVELLQENDSTTRSDDGYEHDRIDSRFHLDDSLWRSATYYAAPDHGDESQQQQQLLALLSSREQRKQLVQLKQFISDVYDTIIGRMRELPPSQLAEAIKSGASLALSCDEWQQQRQFVLLSAAGDPAAIGVLAAVIPSDLQAMSREHFRCRLGLNNLVETAMQDLHAAAECFAPVDPDVDVFLGFLTHERLYDELEFRCVCRYLCAQGGSLGVSCSTKQPVFHPSTMREVLPVASALQLARLLFRVDEQESLAASDARYVEVENAVYRQYQPMGGFQQYEEIVSRYFPAAADILGSPPTSPSSPPGAAPPVASPRTPLSALTRPTNCSQFHAKQYNATASRSPLVRRQHQQQAASQRQLPLSQSGDTDMDGGKWVFFDDVVALLLKYRAEMHSFHLFVQWAVELFALSADAGAGAGAAASAPFMSERAFTQALAPISLGPRDRELRNLFHNALRQRHLRLCMPQRTFTSVVLLLLENRMISVSKYAPMDKPRRARTDELRALLDAYAPVDSAASQGEEYARAWRVLARQWRAREAAFEDAVEALFHVGGDDGLRHALRLMQLRNELHDLLATRPASALLRGFEVYEELVDGVEPRGEAHDDSVRAVGVASEGDAGEVGQEDGDDEQGDWEGEEESGRGESPWPTDPQPA